MNRAAVILVLVLAGCRRGDFPKSKSVPAGDPFSLTVMALVGGNNEEFEERTLDEFAAKKPYKVRYIPAFESDYVFGRLKEFLL